MFQTMSQKAKKNTVFENLVTFMFFHPSFQIKAIADLLRLCKNTHYGGITALDFFSAGYGGDQRYLMQTLEETKDSDWLTLRVKT